MTNKVSDNIPFEYEYDSVQGLQIIDDIGFFLRDEIKDVCTLKGNVYIANVPYTGKIRQRVIDYSANEEPSIQEYIEKAVNDSATGLAKLIVILETTFTATQTAAAIQFNVIIPPATIPIGPTPPFGYIPLTYYTALVTGLPDLTGIYSNAQEIWMSQQYLNNGTF